MLQTNDIGVLFATLQAAYGRQWVHQADAIPVWKAKLDPYSVEQVMKGASQVIEDSPNFPPSLGALLAAIRANLPKNTKLLLPPDFDPANAAKAWDHMEKLAGKKLRPDD